MDQNIRQSEDNNHHQNYSDVFHQQPSNNGNLGFMPVHDYHHYAFMNRSKYPYFRAHHYFFALDAFPRASQHPNYTTPGQAPGSLSYAVDDTNRFNFTFPYDDQKIGQQKIGKIFNRKLFGCPINDGVKKQTKDKNICHSYLFVDQDKGYNIDRLIYTLKHVHKNFQKLYKTNKLRQFSLIRNNQILAPIFSDNLSIEQSKNLIEKNINILKEKRQSFSEIQATNSYLFFKASLNQKLYNGIQILEEQLNLKSIISQIFDNQNTREKLMWNKQGKFLPQHLRQIFNYFHTNTPCVSDDLLIQFSKVADQSFLSKNQANQFQIDFPVTFLCFSSKRLFELTQKLISCRLCTTNQSSFYVFKSFWKRITGHQIPKLAPNHGQQYLNNYKKTVGQLQQFMVQKQTIKYKQEYPILDDQVTLDQLQHKIAEYIFTRKNQQNITNRQYVLIILFTYLYQSLAEIYDFLNQNVSLLGFMGSIHYDKYHHYLINIVNSANFGLINSILQRISSIVLRPQFQLNLQLGFTFNEQKNIAYVYRKTDQQQQSVDQDDSEKSQNEDDDKMLKKVKQQ